MNSSENAALIDALCDEFEEKWQAGQSPRLEDYLTRLPDGADSGMRRTLLVEMVHADLEWRLRADESARVEEYLDRYRELAEVDEFVLDLLHTEYAVRQRREPDLIVDEYLERFPQYRDELSDRLKGKPPSTRRKRFPIRLNCPHCQNPIAIIDDLEEDEVVCPSCGSSFRLEQDRTRSWTPKKLPQLGKFKLLESVGRGAFGTVYRARDTELDRIVAVKVPRSGTFATKEDEDRFVREARSVAQLHHSAVVPVYEVGHSDEFPYLVSQYVEGITLSDALTGRRFEFRESAEIVVQIAEALEHSHERGVIHRDLKSSNIMLQETNGLQVRVMDFGLARRAEGEITVTMEGQVLGTPAYMSPEQARGEGHRVDGRSDVYSAGVILYELLTSELPFRGNSRMLLHQVLNSDPQPPRKIDDRIPRDLETICLKCLEKDRARRYESAGELAEELRRWLSGEPIQARPIGRAQRAWRWCRRNPRIAGLSAAIVVLLITVVVGSVFAALRIAIAQRDAARGEALAAFTQAFEANLDAEQWDEKHVERLEGMVANLRRLDEEKGRAAEERLLQRHLEVIKAQINQPRLTAEDVNQVEGALDLLADRLPEQMAALREALRDRLAVWQPLFELLPPFANCDEVFAPQMAQIQDDALISRSPREEPSVVSTKVACVGNIKLEATFDGSWESTPVLGLGLNEKASGGQQPGYELLLRPQLEGELPGYTLEILRDGVTVRRQVIRAPQIPKGRLHLAFMREGNQLTGQVNELPPIAFEDIFPLSPGNQDVFALRWPPVARLVHLRALHQLTPLSGSPLQQGDSAFANRQFAQALDQYQAQSRTGGQSQVVQEARYKAALCLAALGRQDEAARQFEQLAAQKDGRWSTLAACQLWRHHLEQNRQTDADAVLDNLLLDYRFEELARLLPEDLRRKILDGYGKDIYRVDTHFGGQPTHIRRLERAIAVEELLGAPDLSKKALLVRAYWLAGVTQRALSLSESIVREDPTVLWYMEDFCWMLRVTRQGWRALEEIDGALFESPGVYRQNQIPLLAERAKIHWSLGNPDKAELDLRELLRLRGADQLGYGAYSDAILMLGFLQEQRGDAHGARQTWEEGLRIGQKEIRNGRLQLGPLLRTSILTSLIGELPDELAVLMVQQGMAAYSEGAPTGVLVDMLLSSPENRRVAGSVMRAMWHTAHGRELARKIAFQEVGLRERYLISIKLALDQLLRQFVFQGDLTLEQEQLSRQLSESLYEAVFETQTLKRPQQLQLALAWKGVAGGLGWEGLHRSLSAHPEIRGPLTYATAYRFLRLGQPEEASKLFESTLEDAAPDSQLTRLAEKDKELLARKSGRLVVSNDFSAPVGLLVKRGEEVVATLDVGEATTVELEAGSYALELVDPPSNVSLSTQRIEILPVVRKKTHVNWLWKPGPAIGGLPGIVSQPARLPQLGPWQIETKVPRGGITSIDWSPDGGRIVCGSTAGRVRVYDASTMQLASVMLGHANSVSCVRWSPDGQWIASASPDKTVRLWQADGTRGPVCMMSSNVNAIAWSPDSAWIAAGSQQKAIRLWRTDGTVGPAIETPTGTYALSWSPDGTMLAAVGQDQKGRVWELNGKLEAAFKTEFPARDCVAWHPDGDRLATGGPQGQAIQVWLVDGTPAPMIEGELGRVLALAWSPDGQWLASAGHDRVARLWSEDGTAGPVMEGHDASVLCVAWAPDGDRIASGGRNGTLCTWKADGSLIGKIQGRLGSSRALCWPPSDNCPRSWVSDNTVRQWQPDGTPGPMSKVDASDHLGGVVAWSCDGQRLALGRGRSLGLWNQEDATQSEHKLECQLVSCLAWDPDGHRVAVGSQKPEIGIVVMSADGTSGPLLRGHTGSIQSLAWHPDRSLLASCASDSSVRIWESDGTLRAVCEGHQFAVLWVAWSPGGQWLASGGGDRTVRLWSPDGEPGPVLEGHEHTVLSVAWSPDAQWLASAGRDCTIRLWAADGSPGPVLSQPSVHVETMAWGPDSRRLFCGCIDGTVLMWDVGTQQPQWTSLPLGEGGCVTLSPGGKILHGEPETIEEQLVYLIEKPDGSLEILKPSEFETRAARAVDPQQ